MQDSPDNPDIADKGKPAMIKNSASAATVLVASLICLGLVARPVPAYAAVDKAVFAAGEPGDSEKSARIITVTVRDTDGKLVFDPALVKVRSGEQIRFVVTNAGRLDHEFFLGSPDEVSKHEDMMRKFPDMQHGDANRISIKPGETKEMAWHFTNPGNFEYACLVPGHREAGMFGEVVVD